jgi:hypothetical protein
MRIRRLAATAGTFAAAASLSLALSTPASASVVLYQNDNAKVQITGGAAVALNACIADAKDGVIQTQIVACNQVAGAGNFVELNNVSIRVLPVTPPFFNLYRGNNVNVKVSGGLAAAANACVADAQDGVIQTQIVACNQVASAGNAVNLSGVAVEVQQA